jgi:putative transposase
MTANYLLTTKTKAMLLEEGYIYHIYNQGNNRQKIFLIEDNYLFFLRKIRKYILPYADILAWCLMPNHFHLMALVNKMEVMPTETESEQVTRSHPLTPRTLNDSIAIMLRSYTRALNKQEKRTGALFRERTKAECINCPDGVTPSFFTINGVTQINVEIPERQYPQICFNYIHNNPVKAGLVKKQEDWKFSSAIDYAGLRDGSLINKFIAKKYITIDK